jgi:hypothetical protein
MRFLLNIRFPSLLATSRDLLLDLHHAYPNQAKRLFDPGSR